MKPYYEDDAVTIYHGDCLEIDMWLTAEVLVTDPPYGIGWGNHGQVSQNRRPHSGIANDHDTSTRDAALDLWGPLFPGYVFGSFDAAPPANVKHVLVWQKPADAGVLGSTIGYRRDVDLVFLIGEHERRHAQWSSVVRSTVRSNGGQYGPAGQTGHPHAKPVDLLRSFIDRLPDGVVADPFMGSGSTLVAAKDLGRRAIGVELDERYCEIAAKRCAQEVLDFGGAA